MKHNILFIFTFISFIAFNQKKVIDHTTYNEWKKIESQVISNDGNLIAYHVTPLKGDGKVYVYDVKTGKTDSIVRAQKPVFMENSKVLVFKIHPGYDTLRNCELKKIDKIKWPKDSLGIYFIDNDSLVKIPAVKNFTVPEKGEWIGYTVDSNDLGEKKKKRKFYLFKKNKPVEYKSDGKKFTAYNPLNGKKYQQKDVTEFSISENGKFIALSIHQKIKKDSFYLEILETSTGKFHKDNHKQTHFSEIIFNKQENKAAFYYSKDTSKNKLESIGLYDLNSFTWKTIIDTTNSVIPKTRSVNSNQSILFTEDGSKLYFGVAKRPIKEVKDTLLESEKYKLDLWHFEDKRLQPQQLVELKKDEKKTDLYVYHFNNQQTIQLSNDTLLVTPVANLQGEFLYAKCKSPYQGTYNWTSPNLEDHYIVNINSGASSILKKGVGYGGDLSPKGNYYTYFDVNRLNYYIIDAATKIESCITCNSKNINWQTDNNGNPEVAAPFGVIGWDENESNILIQAEYDVYSYDVKNHATTCFTQEIGKKNNIKLEALLWNRDSIYIDLNNLYFKGLNNLTKANSIYILSKENKLIEMYSTPMQISTILRSKNMESILLRKMSVSNYPDIYLLDKSYKDEKKISTVNPQQKDYNWTTVEWVDWKAYDGTPLRGLLYKPEDYDANKKYPLLVYYYEMYQDDYNVYYAPKPTASIIYPTEYASAGYFVFIPDIRYTPGHPAKSAYNCIMSGTDKVLKMYPNVDSTKMGLQGQSWGGYQTAQLITMTNRFKAAMAGAPVSNMFSAYGGIRWGSGLNRQFQYEKQQSRIGATIWEKPELYIENSPLFHVPKIQTPLLIMANDNDGAVPWYQGIELFTAMKRLGKPCWMLNYNGDDHNLTKTPNKIDLSIRMRQYFDYYLQGKPAPIWLKEGIPATQKGKITGYETH